MLVTAQRLLMCWSQLRGIYTAQRLIHWSQFGGTYCVGHNLEAYSHNLEVNYCVGHSSEVMLCRSQLRNVRWVSLILVKHTVSVVVPGRVG